MRNCLNCGTSLENGDKGELGRVKKFCGRDCLKAYVKDKQGDRKRISVQHLGGDGSLITKQEKGTRERLFREAREGRDAARFILRRKYGMTGLWDGTVVVSL